LTNNFSKKSKIVMSIYPRFVFTTEQQ